MSLLRSYQAFWAPICYKFITPSGFKFIDEARKRRSGDMFIEYRCPIQEKPRSGDMFLVSILVDLR